MIRLFRIQGNSLTPLFKEGELVLGIKPSKLFSLKKNSIVTFSHRKVGTMIKRIKTIQDDEVFVEGTIPQSLDSRTFGTLALSKIQYKILFKIPFL